MYGRCLGEGQLNPTDDLITPQAISVLGWNAAGIPSDPRTDDYRSAVLVAANVGVGLGLVGIKGQLLGKQGKRIEFLQEDDIIAVFQKLEDGG